MADITWGLQLADFSRYVELLEELLAEEEWSDRYVGLLDDIKSLPGFPMQLQEEVDTLYVVLVKPPRVGYTGRGVH